MSRRGRWRSHWRFLGLGAKPVLPWLVLGLSVIAVLAVNPIGFMGGGWDDWQYLDAARCWRLHGPCLPYNHWQGRWPVIAPLALATDVFGESRMSVGLAPLIASLWCLVMLSLIGNRLFRAPVGFVAAGLLLCTTAFAIQLLDPAVEAIELGFGLTGVMTLLQCQRGRSSIWAVLAGLSFGMAFQVRETALVAAGFATIYVASRHCKAPLSQKVIAAGSFVLPFVLEMISFAAMTGDPFYRRRLSLKHTQIPSSELLGPVDRTHSPLFNPAYIANWRREPGVHVHWLIDGILNLMVNAKAGIGLLVVPLIVVTYKNVLGRGVSHMIILLYGVALSYICALIYVLALDPKARIIFFPIAIISLALALSLVRLHNSGRTLFAITTTVCSIGVGLFTLFVHQRIYPVEAQTAEWIAESPGDIEIEENTRRHLALVPAAAALPTLSGAHSRFLVKSDVRCKVWSQRAGFNDDIQLLREQIFSRANMFDDRFSGGLCLFRISKLIAKPRLLAGVAKADWYNLEALKREIH